MKAFVIFISRIDNAVNSEPNFTLLLLQVVFSPLVGKQASVLPLAKESVAINYAFLKIDQFNFHYLVPLLPHLINDHIHNNNGNN